MKRILTSALPWGASSIAALAVLVAAVDVQVPKSMVELQPFRQTTSIKLAAAGERFGTLVNLNPNINVWYLLSVRSAGGTPEISYHLENPRPRERKLLLDEKFPAGLVIVDAGKHSVCYLFDSASVLDQARSSRIPFYPLCGDRILLRNSTIGHRTNLEANADFIRDHVWGVEDVLSLCNKLIGDRYRDTGNNQDTAQSGASRERSSNLPLPAMIDPRSANRGLTSGNLGIALENAPPGGMTPGAWYAAKGNQGIYVSLIQPNLIAPEILQSHKNVVNTLDGAEASALCYLVAFDLDQFDLAYALGTDHPRVGWSDRALPQMRDPKLPGPDGIANISPLVSTGLLSPAAGARTAAVFTAGFKRSHGAFRYGDLALVNHEVIKGFIESGVCSCFQPGLATILVLDNGAASMKTWDVADNTLLPRINSARQNGSRSNT